MTASETHTAANFMAVKVEPGRYPIVRLVPTAGPEERAGSKGPLFEPSASRHAVRRVRLSHYVPRSLIEELLAVAHSRCRLSGAQSVVGGVHSTWSATFQIPASDLDVVVPALEALLRGEEGPLRSYLNSPPQLAHAGQVLAPHGQRPG